jgi:hypothetical protein
MYGYIRAASGDDAGDDEERAKRELAEYAAGEGFTLGRVFIESVRSSEPAFQAMLDALKRTEVKDVVVPSLWHFARTPGLQDAIRQRIEQETGARIWVARQQHR